MPWTTPVLRDKPASPASMCGNPDCYHNAEFGISGFPDNATFGSCNGGCSVPCVIIAAPTLARPGCIMADWSRPFDDPISLPRGRHLVTLKHAAEYTHKLPKTGQLLDEWQAAVEALLLVVELNSRTMMARIGVLRALNRQVERCRCTAKTYASGTPACQR